MESCPADQSDSALLAFSQITQGHCNVLARWSNSANTGILISACYNSIRLSYTTKITFITHSISMVNGHLF